MVAFIEKDEENSKSLKESAAQQAAESLSELEAAELEKERSAFEALAKLGDQQHLEALFRKKSPKTILGKRIRQTRYFVLDETNLVITYFKTKGGKQLGMVPLETITNVSFDATRPERFILQVDSTPRRVFDLLSKTKEESDRWVTRISLLIKANHVNYISGGLASGTPSGTPSAANSSAEEP